MTSHPHRLVALQGASNFRDLGGYPGHQGRPVRWRRLYRSDHLGHLTASDHAELRQRGVAKALDFRGEHESAATAYTVPGLQRHALGIEPTVVQRMHAITEGGQALDAATAALLMEDLYRGIVRQQTAQLSAFFGHVLGSDEALVFHCTAGKDRTGVAAALLLRALGVAPQVVMQDYLLTNQVFKAPPVVNDQLPAEVRQVLWRVRPQYLQAALQVMDDDYGGVPNYLSQALALGPCELDALARRCLEPK